MASYTVKQTVVENLNADLDGKQPVGDYPTNASLTESLQSNLLNYTTNRILEIPQDIKLELNNGTLTLKAGSKVYVPNGFEADGTTPKFDVVVVASDVQLLASLTSTYVNGNYSWCYNKDLNKIQGGNNVWNQIQSNTYDNSAQYCMFYDTTNNIIKYTTDYGATWETGYSLCFCITELTNGVGNVSIDQVFNGFGYIGSTVFALPGVKVQAPNGKDSNRRYLNRELNITQVTCSTVASNVTRGCLWFFIYDDNGIGYVDSFGYDSEHNYSLSGTTPFSGNALCTASATNGVLSNFKPYQVDSIANSNASNFSQSGKSYLSELGMPSNKYIDLTLGASGNTYTAPANGYVVLNMQTTTSDYRFVYLINKTTNLTSLCGIAIANNSVTCTIPVKKGAIFKASYTAQTNNYFRFIYAEGDQ